MAEERFYEGLLAGQRRSAPAVTRNREPIADLLAEWLPPSGLVLEIASGTGEHVVHFAERFPALEWQPSDIHKDALASIEAWRASSKLPNIREPVVLDAASAEWPLGRNDAMLNIKMQSDRCVSLEGPRKQRFRRRSQSQYGPHLALDGSARIAERCIQSAEARRSADPLWALAKKRHNHCIQQSGIRPAATRTRPRMGAAACGGFRGRSGQTKLRA